jgi:hypothetical protein
MSLLGLGRAALAVGVAGGLSIIAPAGAGLAATGHAGSGLAGRAIAARTVASATTTPAAGAVPASKTAALPRVGPWQATGSYLVNSLTQNQGLATVDLGGGRSTLWYDGDLTIPALTYLSGWQHVGDPDSVRGYVTEPYQWMPTNPTSKMFRVWTPAPNRHSFDFVHKLVPGEEMNNSFTALSRDGKWLVAGEWDTENRLLVFPTPLLNSAARNPHTNLPLTGRILLDHPVTDVQGCVFTTSTRLLCSSDDSDATHFGMVKPLLQVDLAAPLRGHDVAGHVTALGSLPLQSICSGAPSAYEAEGLDYDQRTGVLRVEVIQPSPCSLVTTVWEFRDTSPA